ncbi:hypothetical protein AMJ83_11555 [candidate division WOR_3 bacterium SM23_42]|uniref:FlgD/Vpr Ig-like domain-containing protein n=1 Tax=candidate division WOR_3 bacterium SM23_42 TaxID=1703779 RepID=A0A0S8FN18_UNCW3|nr:MAG: hypothetical protein AMJ83_11555 [candidate division WOR_3 bacterium SM23_42]
MLCVITNTCHLSAQTWCPPIRVSQYDTSTSWYYITDQGLTTDGSGTPWCGWDVDCYAGGWIHGILVSRYIDTVWSTPDTINPFALFYGCNLATDANGNVWIVAEDYGISACFYNGSSWSELMQIPTQGTCSHYPAATGDSLGNLWVCWAGGGPGDGHHIWGNTYTMGQWGSAVLISYPGSHEDIAYSMTADKQGRVWIGWHRFSCPDPGICVSFNDGSGWSDTIIIAEYTYSSSGPALTVDTAGRVWAGWVGADSGGPYKLYSSYHDGNVWLEPMLVSESATWGDYSVAITSDDAGNVWLTWVNYDEDIYYSYWNGDNWSNPAPIAIYPTLDCVVKMAFDGERIWVTWIREIDSDRWATYASYTYGVGVEEKPAADSPQPVVQLSQNFPNPFSSKASIFYRLQSDCRISLRLYDTAGRHVRTLVNGIQKPGHHIVNWNGKDNEGKQLPVGIYFLRLETSNQSITKKIVKLE